MKIFTYLFKRLIDLIAFVLRQSSAALEYLFTVALKKQVRDYVENKHFKGYLHIEEAVSLLKSRSDKPDFLIVDVGGGLGETVAIFNKSFPSKKIHSFEPIKSSFINIRNRFEGNPDITVHHTALGNTSGKTRINLAKRITSSSIFELVPSDEESHFNENIEPAGTEEISIEKLDNIISGNEEIDILKLDVQGYEMEVLRGAERCLDSSGIIIVEVANHAHYMSAPSYHEIDEYLRSHGFVLVNLFPNLVINNVLREWDVIYINGQFT